MAVLDIRGTHGSGKTWIIHQLLAHYGSTPIKEDGVHLGYHIARFDAAVLGKYSNVCGGCDGIGKADEVVRRVRLFHKRYKFVLLEGILVAHTFKRYHELATELGDYTFLFLDTPEQVCINRVIERRVARRNTKPFNPKHLKNDFRQVWVNLPPKFCAAGHRVEILPYLNPMPKVLGLLYKGSEYALG